MEGVRCLFLIDGIVAISSLLDYTPESKIVSPPSSASRELNIASASE